MARGPWRGSAPAGEEPLGDAILQRMKGDDDQPASRLEQALGGCEPVRELAELIVEIEPERLEGPRRRVLGLVALPAKYARHDLGELPGG